jgi:hypothetical protein
MIRVRQQLEWICFSAGCRSCDSFCGKMPRLFNPAIRLPPRREHERQEHADGCEKIAHRFERCDEQLFRNQGNHGAVGW